MDVLNQACQVINKDGLFIDHMAISSYEEAIELLQEDGLVYKVEGKKSLFQLQWSNLTTAGSDSDTPCRNCSGLGWRQNTKFEVYDCPECKGSGKAQKPAEPHS